jgi:hypothetical protein
MAVGMPTLVALIGILANHWQVSAIYVRITPAPGCFNGIKDAWRAELGRVEEVVGARLRHLEEQQP